MVELILAHLNQSGDLKSDYDDTLYRLRYPDIQQFNHSGIVNPAIPNA
jgi:hypothetical protein